MSKAMLGVGSWMGSRHKKSSSTHSLNSLDETYQLEDAMRAAALIMDDDVEGAERELSAANSPFHKIGKGVVTFLRATLGFEQEIMKEASERLADAEASAAEHEKRASRGAPVHKSEIYPVGTEYTLCAAEAQLMSAVVGVITESLTESIKGFYKLRKAYITLDGIISAEQKYRLGKSTSSLNSSRADLMYSGSSTSLSSTDEKSGYGASSITSHGQSTLSSAPYKENSVAKEKSQDQDGTGEDEDDDEFFDAEETGERPTSLEGYVGKLDLGDEHQSKDASAPEQNADSKLRLSQPDQASSSQAGSDAGIPTQDSLPSDVLDNPVDIFIHSGSSMAYGLLLLMISLIPPAFATLLKIVGFRGDRDRGISLLWQATRYHNIYGAISGLIVFGYYNGLIGFCDILPETGVNAYPQERLKQLLGEMRRRYPKSHMWQLEEARMTAGDHELEKAVEILGDGTTSPLKQVEALRCFENSLNNMHLHRYEAASEAFQKMVKLNNWSHGLYFYISGSAHLELYRQLKSTDPDKAQVHADKATSLFRLVPSHAGKKRFMARQLPFDVFVTRKLQKWEARSVSWNVPLVDAVGVSPFEEMIYFWNGHRRMRACHLEESLKRLAWAEDSSSNPHWVDEGLDERAILAVLRAAVLRRLNRNQEAVKELRENILCHSWPSFKGNLKDAWPCPVAHYEMAVNLWQERDGSVEDRDRMRECAEWLEKVARWESFELDARIGMKVNTAKDTLKKYAAYAPA